MNMLKAVLFDHDDTLVETIEPKWEQHKYIAKRFYGKTLSDEEIRLHWGKPLTVLISLLYETDHIDTAMSYNLATRSEFPKRLFKDTIPTLNKVKTKGIQLGLITATTASSLSHDFKSLNISQELFEYIQTEDDTLVHKPNPLVFEPALRWLSLRGIGPKQVLYVGDSLKDFEAAKGAGVSFVGVGTGLVSKEEFAQEGAIGIENLSALLSLDLFLSNEQCPKI